MKKTAPSKVLNGKTILVTGGTGSFGKTFVKYLLDNFSPESIRIFSRDELKQWQLKNKLAKHPNFQLLRFFIGDVRDKDRLSRACHKADIIVHTAALKHVPVCEQDPIEAIKTNVYGAINVIDAALDNNAQKVIALSTDKASQPINLYGATKLCSDKLFVQANNYRGDRGCQFSVVRYGNVIGSRGSVIPLFRKQKESGILTITDGNMTRFWLTLTQAVQFVSTSLATMQGGELFIPKIPSMKMIDLAKTIAPKAKIKIVGLRPGEKMHESMISVDEALQTYDLGDRYMLEPTNLRNWDTNHPYYVEKEKVPTDFSYTSANNKNVLSIEKMRSLLDKLKFDV